MAAPAGKLKLYNTLGRRFETFEPRRAGKATLYTCGPTVYDAAHIGNLRTYVFEDVLRRWLTYGHGLAVTQVMNITDVEDKIIAASQAKTAGEMSAFTKPHEERFFADLDALGIERAEHYPRATEYIPKMTALIEQIMERGFAYEREGSIYFDVRKYHGTYGYGRLLNVDFSGFAAGHRIDNDEYDKEDVHDFALWKATPRDGVGWKSPWGLGRPGWHIECSAMAAELLGQPIDIHAAAVDLIFPHHENEIAQSQAAADKPLARYWLHAEHLLVDGKKMAKSAGNFTTLGEIRARGYAPGVLRLLFLQAHYRSKLNFTWESLAAAQESHARIQEFYARLAEPSEAPREDPVLVREHLEEARRRLVAAMDDDLNTAEALAAVFDFIRDANRLIDQGKLGPAELGAILGMLKRFDQVLGILTQEVPETTMPEPVKKLVNDRENARAKEDFAAADRLRKKIEAAGFTLEDTPQGTRLKPKRP